MILRHLPGEFSEAIRHSGSLESGGLIQTLSSALEELPTLLRVVALSKDADETL